MITDDELDHRPDCPNPRAGRPFRGQRGDLLVRCRSCAAMQVVPEPTVHAAASAIADNVAQPEPEPVSRWWCREHLAPCDHRGNGCAECEHEHEQAAPRRHHPEEDA